MIGNESPPQAPKFLGYTASQGRSSKAREKYIQYEFLPPKAAENLQLPPPLFFEKSASKGGVAGIITPDI